MDENRQLTKEKGSLFSQLKALEEVVRENNERIDALGAQLEQNHQDQVRRQEENHRDIMNKLSGTKGKDKSS